VAASGYDLAIEFDRESFSGQWHGGHQRGNVDVGRELFLFTVDAKR
jgi:hypothetical protein